MIAEQIDEQSEISSQESFFIPVKPANYATNTLNIQNNPPKDQLSIHSNKRDQVNSTHSNVKYDSDIRSMPKPIDLI